MPFTLFKAYRVRKASLKCSPEPAADTESAEYSPSPLLPHNQSWPLIDHDGLYVVEDFHQVETLKLVSLAEAQNDDTIRLRDEAFEVEERLMERVRLDAQSLRQKIQWRYELQWVI